MSYFSTEGFRPVNDNSDNLALNGRLDYHLGDDTVIRGFARYIASNVSLPNLNVTSGSPLDPTAHQRNEFMLFKGEVEHHFGENVLVRANAYYVRQDLRDTGTPYPGNMSFQEDRIPDETRGGLIETVFTWPRFEGFRTLAGFDFKDRWVRSDGIFRFLNLGPPPPPPHFITSISLFDARRQEYAGYLEQEGSFFNGHVLDHRRISRRWQQRVRQGGQPRMVGRDSDYTNLDHLARQLHRRLSRAGIRRAVLPGLRQSQFEAGDFERVGRRIHHQLRRAGRH